MVLVLKFDFSDSNVYFFKYKRFIMFYYGIYVNLIKIRFVMMWVMFF